MFSFNRNEQIVLLMLSAALLVGIVVTYLDKTNSDAIVDFDVQKNAVPVPDMPEEQPSHAQSTGQDPIDINQATAKDFQKLPGIGPALAQRIIDHRTANGNFQTLEELTKVSGIGEKTLARIHAQLTISTP